MFEAGVPILKASTIGTMRTVAVRSRSGRDRYIQLPMMEGSWEGSSPAEALRKSEVDGAARDVLRGHAKPYAAYPWFQGGRVAVPYCTRGFENTGHGGRTISLESDFTVVPPTRGC
jgi:hypothetical protein